MAASSKLKNYKAASYPQIPGAEPTYFNGQLTQIQQAINSIQTGMQFSDINGLLLPTQLPTPTVSTLGGVKANLGGASQWLTSLQTSGRFTLAQPSFSDLLGSATLGQLPAGIGLLASNNTWTGNQKFNGAVTGGTTGAAVLQVGSGQPWADVKAWGATGNGTTDDTTAVQNAINFMQTTYGGGYVFFPPGWFYVASGLTISASVILMGCGMNVTVLSTQQPANRTLNDVTVVSFTDASIYPGIRDTLILGYSSNAATAHCLDLASSVSSLHGTLERCIIVGGNYAIHTRQATDWRINNCLIAGMNGGVISNGANYWTDCSIDTGFIAGSTGTAFVQAPPISGTAVQENQFSQVDLSGAWTASISINAAGTALAKFMGCVISSPIVITNAVWTAFSTCEVPTSITVGTNPTSFSACNSYTGAVVVSGSGKAIDSSCFNIT